MIKFKEGVSVEGIIPRCISGMSSVACYMNYAFDQDLVVTSVTDGKHKDGSKHYTGEAFDMRTWTTPTSGIQMKDSTKEALADDIRFILGGDWDVVVEGSHIHCEYDLHV